MGFIDELKRRNVFRVSGAYAVLGWLVIEVVDTLAPRMALPDWVPGFVIILVLAGFPIAAVFAWAFELTPEGVKRTEDVDSTGAAGATTGQRVNYVIIAALLGVVLWQQFAPGLSAFNPFSEAADGEVVSIAVLPFADLSPDGDQEYLGDGVAEEILNVLARIDGLQVTSRTSAFSFKEQSRSIREIASALGVGHVVEGSVRKQGDQVRIAAQLIDVSDDSQLWSQTYDSDLSDIFRLQDEIARQISGALSEGLQLALPEVAGEVADWDVAAYELFLRARQALLTRRRSAEAIRLAEAAVVIEPDFADAWAVIGAAQTIIAFGEASDPARWDAAGALYDEAWLAARRAVEVDPQNSLGLAVLGNVKTQQKEWTEARVFLERATGVASPDPNAILWLGILESQTGLLDDALATFDRGLEIHPGDLNLTRWKVSLLALQGRWEEARRSAEVLAPLGDADALMGQLAAGLVLGENGPEPLVEAWTTLEIAGPEREDRADDATLELMRRLLEPTGEVAPGELPWSLMNPFISELAIHFRPEAFTERLLQEIPRVIEGPGLNRTVFYFAEQLQGVRN